MSVWSVRPVSPDVVRRPATRVASRAVALAVPCAFSRGGVCCSRVSATHQCQPGATTLTIAAVGDSLTFDHECKPSVGGNVLHIGPYYDATCDINQTWPAIATRRLREQPCSPALGCRHAVIRNFGRRGVGPDPGPQLLVQARGHAVRGSACVGRRRGAF